MRARTLSATLMMRFLLGSASPLTMAFGRSTSVMEDASRSEASGVRFLVRLKMWSSLVALRHNGMLLSKSIEEQADRKKLYGRNASIK